MCLYWCNNNWFSRSVPWKIFQGLGTDQTREVGVITEDNIPSTDEKQNYQREIKLFEFSRDTSTEELKIRINKVTLQ